jgi:thiamine-phosphate pyrophosphorylase
MLSRLQYISQGETFGEQAENIQRALEAGCDWIQLRFKNASESEFLKVAYVVKALCEKHNATFIINDHVTLAREIDADGVHLGLNDVPIGAARAILGNKIIGGTANTFEDVKKRVNEKADYIGLGPLRFTTTKAKLSPELGFRGYAEITSKMKALGFDMPIYAIGGIVAEDIPGLLEAGCYGVAVSGSITNATGQKKYVEQLKSMLHGTLENSR